MLGDDTLRWEGEIIKTLEDAEELYFDIQGYSWRDTETAYNLVKTIYNTGHSIAEFLEYMEFVKKMNRYLSEHYEEINRRFNVLLPACPDCGTKMMIQEGDDDDTHYICGECRFSKYSEKSMKDHLKDAGLISTEFGFELIENKDKPSIVKKHRDIRKKVADRIGRMKRQQNQHLLMKGR